MKCDILGFMKLGLDKFNPNIISIFNLLAPFANEISNILTISGFVNLYPHHPKNNLEIYKKALFDFISLVGIVSNASYYSKYGYKNGLLKGIVLIVFTFLIPNLFMYDFLKFAKTNIQKLLLGFVIVYILEFLIQFTYCFISKTLKKEKYHIHKH